MEGSKETNVKLRRTPNHWYDIDPPKLIGVGIGLILSQVFPQGNTVLLDGPVTLDLNAPHA